jgi:hypothetical protein
LGANIEHLESSMKTILITVLAAGICGAAATTASAQETVTGAEGHYASDRRGLRTFVDRCLQQRRLLL